MLNIAVIGLGWWGRVLVGLARPSYKLRVVRVADVSPQAQAFAAEHDVLFSSTLDEVLRDSAVQAVVLCTPHTQHAEQIVAAARAGKHVFREKPLSMTRRDVLRAVAAVEQAGVALAVGPEKRFEPPSIGVFGSQGWAEVRDRAHPEAPEGWTLTTCLRGGRMQSVDMPPTPRWARRLIRYPANR